LSALTNALARGNFCTTAFSIRLTLVFVYALQCVLDGFDDLPK
jgi:hypothetical protein